MSKYILNLLCMLSVYSIDAQFHCQKGFEKEIALSKIIEDLSLRYQLNFAYPTSIIQDISLSPPSDNYTKVESLIQAIFKETTLEYEVQDDKNILLRAGGQLEKSPSSTYKISGIVKDKNTDTGLALASVYLDNFEYGTFTDGTGRFDLKINKATKAKNIIISYIGYKEILLPLHSYKTDFILHLEENTLEIEDVLIEHSRSLLQANLDDFSIGINKSTSDKAAANLLGGPDIFRIVQMLPGVSAHNDDSAEIQIRGSNANETMILLDHIPIYHTDHYYGVFGVVNAHYVEETQLFKNILPIQYQGGSAGLLKMSSSDEITDLTGDLNFNLLNTSLNLELPLNGKVSLQMTGRTTIWDVSNFQLLNEQADTSLTKSLTDDQSAEYIDTNPDFQFYDLNAKVNIKSGKNSTLLISGFRSHDKFENIYSNQYIINRPNVDLLYKESYALNENWKNNGISAYFKQNIKNKLSLHTVLHYSKYNAESNLQSSINVSAMNFSDRNMKSLINNNEVIDAGANVYFEEQQNKKYKIGLSWNNYQASNFIKDQEAVLRNVSKQSNLFTLYASHLIKAGNWKLDLGIRIMDYIQDSEQDFYFSPQALSTYALDASSTLKLSVGQNFQFVRNIQYENRVGQIFEVYSVSNSTNIPVGKSINYMLGYNYKKADWSFDFEFFYKDMSGSLEFTNVNPGFLQDDPIRNRTAEYRLFSGTTMGIGTDFMLSYQNKNYSSWIAYTLSKTDNQFEKIFNNKIYPNQNDRRHQFKWVNNYRHNDWGFSLNYIYSSGKPYLSFINLKELLTRENSEPKEVFDQLAYYSRIDVGLTYHFKLFKEDACLGVSVFNLTNRQNVKYIQQTYAIPLQTDLPEALSAVIGNEASLLDRTIDFSFSLRF